MRRSPGAQEEAGAPRQVSTVFYRLAQTIRTVLLLAYPVIPGAANRFWGILGCPARWKGSGKHALHERIPAGHTLNVSEPVFKRIEQVKEEAAGGSASLRAVDGGQGRPPSQPNAAAGEPPALPGEPPALPAYITIDDFAKIEQRTGEIRTAERVDGADKLLKLTVFDASASARAGGHRRLL